MVTLQDISEMEDSNHEELDQQFLEACETGNVDEVLRILYFEDNGATKLLDINPDSLDHMHYFHAACFHGNLDIVEQLIVFKADVNLNSRYGTPLAVACQGGDLKTVKLLEKHNAKVYDLHSLDFRLSPMFQACKGGHLEVLAYLLTLAPEALATIGQQLLIQACHDGFFEIVVLLLSKDLDVNGDQDYYVAPTSPMIQVPGDMVDHTPMHAACSQGNTEIVEYLLQEGAKVTVDLVERYPHELGDAVRRNFKEYSGKFSKDGLLCADFRACNFHAIHRSWFTSTRHEVEHLVEIDVSNNCLKDIPKELFNLASLKKIDVSCNELFSLPEIDDVCDSSLEEIIVSSNALSTLPLSFFQLKSLRHLTATKNMIQSLEGGQGYLPEMDHYMADEIAWHCTALKSLNLAKNELSAISTAIHSAKSLEKLQLSNNKISSFPVGWKCPLRILDLSKNELEDFQESIFTPWKQTLEDLNLSCNKLTEITWDICQLDSLQRLDLGHNKIEAMPPKSYWTCKNLRRLILQNNKLCGVHYPAVAPVQKRFSLARSASSQDEALIEDEFAYEVYGGSLESLDLKSNNLTEVPSSVCQLTALEELDLSGNRNLHTLPPELGNLTECYILVLEGLNLTGIPRYVRPGRNTSSKDLLAYLRAKQRKSVPYHRMKLMVIGLQGRGKTTLLAALRGKSLPQNISTVGIVVNEWTMQRSDSLLGKLTKPSITFSTWDLAGQQIYYSTHQCFLSSNTLYLAVWNVSLGDKGVETLKPWLLNVQARAPGSHVIIVGTHADLLPEEVKAKRIDELRLAINKKYDKKGYPLIKGNIVVSCTTGENITALRQSIYEVAVDLKESESLGRGEALIGRKIPLSYLKLQENVIKEAEIRKKENKPPFLNEQQMLALAKRDANNDIFGREELVLAARFLHENGVILHYDDKSRGLDKLYFIEPAWLCDIMALLVTVKESNAFVKGGIVLRCNVNLLLKSPRLPEQFMDQYIQLMERFEVALTLDDTRLLVPSMLPRDKPGLDISNIKPRSPSRASNASSDSGMSEDGQVNQVRQVGCLVRLYKMNYVPSGFWSRLIARLMIAVQRWGAEEGIGDELICSQAGKTVRATGVQGALPCGYSMIYWREGIGVVYEGGHLMVESFVDKERNSFTEALEDIEGVKVTVWSGEQDFSVLGFVTDQINSLISEWYPGLEENDNHGIPLVRHVIPCPTCAERHNSLLASGPPLRGHSIKLHRAISADSLPVHDDRKRLEFSLTECAAAAVAHKEITCAGHPREPVKLEYLVPDLLLSDLPDELLIDTKLFQFQADEELRLGCGGAGEVFLASYMKQKVAVKRFYSTKETWKDSGVHSEYCEGGVYVGGVKRGGSRHTDGGSFVGRHVFTTSVFNIEEELQRTKILSSFWELRQEVCVLARLNHPCVVSLIGVCVQPLCIVLELSPLGSLYSILENALKKEEEKLLNDSQKTVDIRNTVFDRELTYKIIYQVAHALSYLHSLGVIYRDLKSDNLLAWSLDNNAIVHVKLSDYGISRFSTPQGMLGEEGTPGFQAPEVRTRATYNEKVDIFSFAMVIYEVLSGYRPYHECRSSAQIKKTVRRGERPSLEAHSIDAKMPNMEALMQKCWREAVADRPSSGAILNNMEDPSFLCLTKVLPYADQKKWTDVTTFIPLSTQDQVFSELSSSKGDHSILIWSGENEDRRFSVVDCQTGFFQIKETPCIGHRVSCAVKVGDRYWLGTEGSTIDVFGRPCLGSDLRILWSFKVKAQVLALLVDQDILRSDTAPQSVSRVFASLANGTLLVISRPQHRKPFSTSSSLSFRADATEKLRQEAAVYSVTTVLEVGPRQTPACCMVAVNDGKELWVGCGNHIVTVNVETLEILHKFRVFMSSRNNIRVLVSYDNSVFTFNRQSATFLQYDIKTCQLVYKFSCDQDTVRGDVIAEKILVKPDPELGNEAVENENFSSPSSSSADAEQIEHTLDEASTTPDEIPADPQILPDVPNLHRKPPSLMRSLRTKDRKSYRRKQNDVATAPESSAASGHMMRSRARVISGRSQRITCALVVEGNLWIGRVTGDIVVIDVSCFDDYGKVLGLLSLGVDHDYLRKEVNGLHAVGGDSIVSCGCLTRNKAKPSPAGETKLGNSQTRGSQSSFTASTSPFKSFLRPTSASILRKKPAEELPPDEKVQVAVWARWRREDFEQFFKYHSDLENL